MPHRCAARALLVILLAATAVLGPVAPRPASATPPTVTDRIVLPTGTAYAQAGWAASAPVAAQPFAMVGLEVGDERRVQLRTAEGDGPWSAWVDVPHLHDEGPDPGSDEAASAHPGHRTHPVFTGPADRLQVRAEGSAPAATAAWLIDPLGLRRGLAARMGDALAAAWSGAPDPAAAQAAQPAVVTRAGWGADESIVRNPPSHAQDVDRIFVHHTVGSNSYTQAQAAGVVRGIQAYHVNGNGWSDIGYNLLVDRFGTVYEGRAGGIDRAVIGAQAGGFNTRSSGIALLGTFSDAAPEAAALTALAQVAAWKADIHHLDPLGHGTAISGGSSRYPEGTAVTLPNLTGHRDVSATSCPGDGLFSRLPALRADVRARAGDLVVDHDADVRRATVVRGDPQVDAVTVGARLDPPGAWAVEVRDPQGRVVHTDHGEGAEVRSTWHLAGGDWALGTYTWSVGGGDRTPATGLVELVPPVIADLRASAPLVTADRDGVLHTPLGLQAQLWDGATWDVVVTDPSGATVHTATGEGSILVDTWTGLAADEPGPAGDLVPGGGPAGVDPPDTALPGARRGVVTDPGTYLVTATAEDAAPVAVQVEVRYDLLPRVGADDTAIGAAVATSAATFAPGAAEHAVLARHDLFADALAGGPLAGSGGPLLLTTSDALDPRVAGELDRVLAEGATVYVLGGTSAISDAVVDAVRARHGRAVRIAGDDRVATAAAVAPVVVARSGSTTAMVARAGSGDGAPWADALAGGAWGAARGVPVLLSAGDALSPATADAVAAMGTTDAVVLGGTAALSDAVAAALPDPVRIAGDDRAATAVAIAERLWGEDADAVVLGNGYDADAWVWALTAAPLAARRGAPLLLTSATALPAATADHLDRTTAAGGVALGPVRLVAPEVVHDASDRLR